MSAFSDLIGNVTNSVKNFFTPSHNYLSPSSVPKSQPQQNFVSDYGAVGPYGAPTKSTFFAQPNLQAANQESAMMGNYLADQTPAVNAAVAASKTWGKDVPAIPGNQMAQNQYANQVGNLQQQQRQLAPQQQSESVDPQLLALALPILFGNHQAPVQQFSAPDMSSYTNAADQIHQSGDNFLKALLPNIYGNLVNPQNIPVS